MTQCTPTELRAKAPGRREIVARFDGGDITSDAGVLLLGEVEAQRRILGRAADCLDDFRDPSRVEHSAAQLLAQRVLAIALGYEDVVDHKTLRDDPLLATVVGKVDPKGKGRKRQRDGGRALAGPATLHRMELSYPGLAQDDRYCKLALDHQKLDQLLIDVCLEAHDTPPDEIVLDLDATDDPIHGKQEGRFFHGYYNHYCYLPLYIFAGDLLLCARLRKADRDGADGSVEELQRIVPRLREAWPQTRIIIRADSGFCREALMTWCESEENVEFVLGLARNSRLEEAVAADLDEMEMKVLEEDGAHRTFRDLDYRTRDSWSRSRRVVAKAEALPGRRNPLFVVTSLATEEWDARRLYEDLYCARGDMENRIKEQQLYLFADRTSSSRFRANQFRLYLSSLAYVLINELRRIGLKGTEMARAQCGTIRTKLFKIGARVRVTARKIWVAMSEIYPYQQLLAAIWARLRAA